MRFGLLGPLEAWGDEGHEIPLGTGRERAVLLLLLLHAGEVLSKDRLIDDLWHERPPATAAKVLQGYVAKLRRTLPPDSIVTRGSGYVLRAAQTDAVEFERLLDDARRQEPSKAAQTLGSALALWRGPALADVPYEAWAQPEIARLEELRLVAVEQRIEAELQVSEDARLVPELEALVAEHPLRERLRAQLMLALYRTGRQPDSLEVYTDLRGRLVDELGVEPGKSLRELHRAILRQDPTLDLVIEAEPAAEPTRSAFVGREPELAALVGALEDVIGGHGRVFLLVGEPGIGKSRLVEEVSRRATVRGVEILVGRCWEAGGAPAYWPWVQSLRAHIRETDPDVLQRQLGKGGVDLAQILPELHEIVSDLGGPPAVDSEAARFRLFAAVAELLRNSSADRPLLVFLDDLHAADAASLLLLQFVAREVGSSRVLLVGALRDVDPVPGQPLTSTLAEIMREPVTRRLSLAGLSKQDVAEYVELSASDLSSAELATALYAQTEGNPLFLTETVRLLALEGGGGDGSAEGKIAIPQSVRDAIGRRLGHLTEECNDVLVDASVLGREFALDPLTHMRETTHVALLETLDEAMTARVVSDAPGMAGHLRFAHVLIRDTLYEGLTTARRVRLHRLALEALESLHGEDAGPHLAELVHHAIAGSEFEKGVVYAQRAGDRALALFAYEEAARLYRVALDGLELARLRDEEVRCQLLLSLGEAENVYDRRAAKDVFAEAAEIARRLGLSRTFARAALGYGGPTPWVRAGGDRRVVPLLEQALDGLSEEELDLRARLLARLAGALRDEHSRARRDVLSNEAVELARRSGNAVALMHALEGRAESIMAPDTLTTSVELASELIELAERVGDRRWGVHGHASRHVARTMLGDIEGAETDLTAQIRLVDELREPPIELFHSRASQAMLALARGGLVEAEKLVDEAFAISARAQVEIAMSIYGIQSYTLADFRGDLEGVEQAIRDLVIDYPARPVFRCVLAHLRARRGAMDEARRHLDDLARDDFALVPFDQEWVYGMSLLAETCALLGERGHAAVLYRLLRPWGALNATNPPEGFRGSAWRDLGLLASTLERWDEAAAHFENALGTNVRMGARPWLAQTQHDYSRMLLARDKPGDSERGKELRAIALDTYRELGMEGYLASAEMRAPARQAGGLT